MHGAIGVFALWTSLTQPEPVVFESYEIIMVEAPPQPDRVVDEETLPAEELVVDTPDPEPPPPDPQPVVETPPPLVDDVVEKPEEEKPEETPEEEKPAPKPDPTPPEPEPTTNRVTEEDLDDLTGEELTIRMEGLERDYPAYYGNIVRQLQRCFRPPRSRAQLSTTIYFEIRPNGSTAEERLYERSGNADLDYGALAAVADCAGAQQLFGPLPDDYPYQRLPVLFTFRSGGLPSGPEFGTGPATR